MSRLVCSNGAAGFYNQSSNQERNRKKKTKGKHQFSVKGPNYNSENIQTIFCMSGFPWRKDCFSIITGAMCQWSPRNMKSLSACSHQEVASQAFLECPEIKESWHRVKASKKQQRSRHLLLTTHFPVTQSFSRLAPNSLHA